MGASASPAFSKIEALVTLKHHKAALHELRHLCKELDHECGPDPELVALVLTFPPFILAQYWAGLIAKAECRNPLSARDGLLLRKVPLELQLAPVKLVKNLAVVLQGNVSKDIAESLLDAWSNGEKLGRGILSLLRGCAYAEAGDWSQALKDAQTARSYPPSFVRRKNPNGDWPRALAAYSQALEGLQIDNTAASLNMAKANCLDPANEEYAESLKRLMKRIPEAHADALQMGGFMALEEVLAHEAEEALPEYKKRRSKYYYYYKWMRDRVTKACGELPAPVLEKLICIDATELDMLLTYPNGIKQQAQTLLEVLEAEGLEALSEYRLPLLSWKEAQALKAEHALLTIAPDEEPSLLPNTETRQLASLESIFEEEDLDAPEPIESSVQSPSV